MKRLKSILSAALITGLVSMNALAQSSDFNQLHRNTGPEARVTFTVPIGPKSRTAKDKTRLEFGVRQYQNRSDDINWALNQTAQIYGDDFNESRIGFTLNEKPRLMLNGQEWNEMNTQLSIDGEVVGIAIGVTSIVVAGFVVVAIIIPCSEDNTC